MKQRGTPQPQRNILHKRNLQDALVLVRKLNKEELIRLLEEDLSRLEVCINNGTKYEPGIYHTFVHLIKQMCTLSFRLSK